MKKKSGIFSFRVNDILTSILSALHPFLTLPNDVLKCKRGTFFLVSRDLMKGTKRYLFCRWKQCSQKREKRSFLAVGSDVQKRAKKVPFWQLEVMFSKARKSHGKPFRNLLIDRCQPFDVIFMNFFVWINYWSISQEINIPCLLAKFETNCWAWHCNMYSVRSQF